MGVVIDSRKIEKLIIQSKQGYKEAIAELLITYEPLVKKYSRHYFVKGYEDEDLEQVARMAIIKSVDKFDIKHGANFTGFIDRSIRNAIITLLKNRENNIIFNSLESTNDDGEEFKEMFSDGFDMEDYFIEREASAKLQKVLDRLEPDEKELLLMSYKSYGSLKKYSKIVGKPYYDLRRKRNKLINKIKKELFEKF